MRRDGIRICAFLAAGLLSGSLLLPSAGFAALPLLAVLWLALPLGVGAAVTTAPVRVATAANGLVVAGLLGWHVLDGWRSYGPTHVGPDRAPVFTTLAIVGCLAAQFSRATSRRAGHKQPLQRTGDASIL